MVKQMAIVTGYAAGESHGLMGPQLAATVIAQRSGCRCIVIAVSRETDQDRLRAVLDDYFGSQRPLVGFSAIGGRDDLVALAGSLKQAGAVTVLAGPQADVDFIGETGWQRHEHRFKGFSDAFSFALHGPAEQFVRFPGAASENDFRTLPGAVYRAADGGFVRNPPKTWADADFRRVDWANIYRLEAGGLVPLNVTAAQVLQQVGCPHAAREKRISIDYPAFLPGAGDRGVVLPARGCSFCDVAVDKGFHGSLDRAVVMDQIDGLPEGTEGRKIPFELINENPLFGLPKLMQRVRERNIRLSRIHLTLRADWLVRGEPFLRDALRLAGAMGVTIALTSVGFEAFDDDILRNLNKGATLSDNLKAVDLIRRLKAEFGDGWGYLRSEGGNHGFIHPTPWDTPARTARRERLFDRYRLRLDILPRHSTPLIIHHASRLGDWIREIEKREGVRFQRLGAIIAWWQIGDRCYL